MSETTIEGRSWTAHANCFDAGIDMVPDPQDLEAVERAVAVCEGCPVMAECWSEGYGVGYGVWAGKLAGTTWPYPRHAPGSCEGRGGFCGDEVHARGLCVNCYSRYFKARRRGLGEEGAMEYALRG